MKEGNKHFLLTNSLSLRICCGKCLKERKLWPLPQKQETERSFSFFFLLSTQEGFFFLLQMFFKSLRTQHLLKERNTSCGHNFTFSCIFFFNPQTINCLWKKKARDVSYVPALPTFFSSMPSGHLQEEKLMLAEEATWSFLWCGLFWSAGSYVGL